jgi:hypothetical protein
LRAAPPPIYTPSRNLIAACFALVCGVSSAAEIEVYAHDSNNGNRSTLDDASVRLQHDSSGSYASAWGYTYMDGKRYVYTYVVYGCRDGYGTVNYGRDDTMLTFYWTRDGRKNGDAMARAICERSVGRSM